MKKFLLILLIVFSCFGCTAKYQLKINEDLSVEETITGLEDDDFYNKYYNSTKSRVINFVMATQQDYLDSEGFNETSDESKYGATVSKKYQTLDEYLNSSKAYMQYYNLFTINNNDGIVDISLSDKLGKNPQDPKRYVIDDGIIEIILPFKVLEHNADNYDSTTNKYTWLINSASDKNIHISFDSHKVIKKTDYDFIIVIVLLFLFLLSTFLIIKIYRNRQLEKDKI